MGMDLWFEERISKREFNDTEIAYWRNRHYIKNLVEAVTGEPVLSEDNSEIPVTMAQMIEMQRLLLERMTEEGPTDIDTYDEQVYDLEQICKCLVFLATHEFIWFSASW